MRLNNMLAGAALLMILTTSSLAGTVNYFHGKDSRLWRRNLPAPLRLRRLNLPAASSASQATLDYATFLGGGNDDHAAAVTTDSAGNIYVAGNTKSADFPVTPDAFQTTSSLRNEAFVAKFTPDGALIFCTYLGGSGDTQALAVAVDGEGNTYVAGQTTSLDFPTSPGAIFESLGPIYLTSARLAFVTKLNSVGNAMLYSTMLGSGSSLDTVYGIAVDAGEDVFVTGLNQSPEFLATLGAAASQSTVRGFVAKINPAGTHYLYTAALQYYGDTPSALAVDSFGNAYLTGSTSDLTPRGATAIQPLNAVKTLFQTVDGGGHWAPVMSGLEGKAVYSVAVDPQNGSVVYAATSAGVFKSVDGTKSWQAVFAGQSVRQVIVDPSNSGHVLFQSMFGGFYASRDAGATWALKGNPGFNDVKIDASHPLNVYGVNFSGVSYSRDGGETFTYPTYTSFYGWANLTIDPLNSQTLYARTSTQVLKSLDGGVTWRNTSTSFFYGVAGLVADPKNQNVLYVSQSNGSILKSMDGGTSWLPTGGTVTGSSLAFDPAGSTLYAFSAFGLYQSTDKGATFAAVSTQPLNSRIAALAFDAQHVGTFYGVASFGSNGFVTKLAANGATQLFSTYYGGGSGDSATSLAIDSSGDIVIAGNTSSPDLEGTAAGYGGGGDVFVAKLRGDGSQLLWSRFLGGASADVANALTVDRRGNFYVAGYTRSPDFPVSANALQKQYPSNANQAPFFAQIDSSGGLVFASYLGGAEGDTAYAIAVDPSGRLCIAGDTNSPEMTTTPGAAQPTRNGFADAFLVIINLIQ